MTGLVELAGLERSLQEVARTLYFQARAMGAPVVGALQVTCSDETEGECLDAFHQQFVQHLLPSLKFARRAAFRTSNLGGRYEWSAVRLAEAHFAVPPAQSAGKLMIVKINAHCGWEPAATLGASGGAAEGPPQLGVRRRYGRELPCCGALAAVMAGVHAPHADDLRETLESEGLDRLGALADPARVNAPEMALFAAIASARLQARKALLDIQDYTPDSPTYFVVLPAVTINRPERDTEIVCGVYLLDGRDGSREATYSGLGDDPSRYETRVANRRLIVTDDHLGRTRPARDHRAVARTALRTHTGGEAALRDARLDRLRLDVAENRQHRHHHGRSLLRMALPVLAEVAPIPAAILAFGDGAVGIHHAFRVQKLARRMAGDAEARKMLAELESRIDTMDPDRAEALVELLTRAYHQ
jgi:hypothetical protein